MAQTSFEQGAGKGATVAPAETIIPAPHACRDMERYDLVYQLYDEFDTKTLREYQEFVDVFPPVDSRVALEHWQEASEELEARKDDIRTAFVAGETFAEIASRTTRDQACTALDLEAKYGRPVNVLVLDVDETLRSAGSTDNEIPRDTLHVLTEFYEAGIPIVICTGQTLENVKGFTIQGLGNGIVHSGAVSIVYEAGNGVFTPGHGSQTKQLLYEGLDEEVRTVFETVRSRVLPAAPDDVRRGCHLQGNEFNVTLKPNFESGTDAAEAVIDRGLVHLVDLLGEVVVSAVGIRETATHEPRETVEASDSTTVEASDSTTIEASDSTTVGTSDPETCHAWARAHYAEDPEIRSVLESGGIAIDRTPNSVPTAVTELFDRIDVGYHHADSAEISSLELNKAVGVEAALDVLGVEDPFVLVMGDSKSDLRVMEWAEANDCGIAAAPAHASSAVLEHVLATDELVFDRGEAADVLRTVLVMNRLAGLE